jgi:hypothetical protein
MPLWKVQGIARVRQTLARQSQWGTSEKQNTIKSLIFEGISKLRVAGTGLLGGGCSCVRRALLPAAFACEAAAGASSHATREHHSE